MTSLADQTQFEPEPAFRPIRQSRLANVPDRMADRISSLYAAEELRDRCERTARLIKQAQELAD